MLGFSVGLEEAMAARVLGADWWSFLPNLRALFSSATLLPTAVSVSPSPDLGFSRQIRILSPAGFGEVWGM